MPLNLDLLNFPNQIQPIRFGKFSMTVVLNFPQQTTAIGFGLFGMFFRQNADMPLVCASGKTHPAEPRADAGTASPRHDHSYGP